MLSTANLLAPSIWDTPGMTRFPGCGKKKSRSTGRDKKGGVIKASETAKPARCQSKNHCISPKKHFLTQDMNDSSLPWQYHFSATPSGEVSISLEKPGPPPVCRLVSSPAQSPLPPCQPAGPEPPARQAGPASSTPVTHWEGGPD